MILARHEENPISAKNNLPSWFALLLLQIQGSLKLVKSENIKVTSEEHWKQPKQNKTKNTSLWKNMVSFVTGFIYWSDSDVIVFLHITLTALWKLWTEAWRDIYCGSPGTKQNIYKWEVFSACLLNEWTQWKCFR